MFMHSNQKNTRTRLRTWREEAGLTLAGAANKLGISKATLGPIELGRLRPSRPIAKRIEAHFGESISNLLKAAPRGAVPRLVADAANQDASVR